MSIRARFELPLALSLFVVAQVASAQTYTVAINHAPPYRIVQEGEEGSAHSGFYVDIMREAATRAGIDLEFKVVPFKRALVLLERGEADIMLGPNRTVEREAYLDYLDVEISREAKVFYLREDEPDIVDYADLAGRRIAVLRGAKYFDQFDSDEDLEKVKLASYATAIRVVEGGRVDALIMPELQGDYLLKEHGQPLRKSTYSVPGRPSYIAVSKRSPLQESRESLLRALRSMDEDGTTAAIISRYR